MNNNTNNLTKTKVKICGIQTEAIAQQLSTLPVDFVGFVFAESKRKVTAEKAAELIQSMERGSYDPMFAGVFVNPTMEQLENVLHHAPLHIVQLHGEESPDFCKQVKASFPNMNIFKVFSVNTDGETSIDEQQGQWQAIIAPYAPYIDGVMLDTVHKGQAGGTGKTFAWDTIPDVKQCTDALSLPLIVAGGLHADNVQPCIAQYAPDGVDVSSGVESNGEKDTQKIEDFVKQVKEMVNQ
ncbi:phosphoribosylanthranilate isomerase [Longirhabdus pacifica]|uniref:phosphoribosylanthranilate isomerase n=1 Tax=Longirhabdus pacifica TaxID=2305227 RepID=UPI001009089F|nr:phosphoribosylanthranilate isomerase [Longirhabdus pacifica]